MIRLLDFLELIKLLLESSLKWWTMYKVKWKKCIPSLNILLSMNGYLKTSKHISLSVSLMKMREKLSWWIQKKFSGMQQLATMVTAFRDLWWDKIQFFPIKLDNLSFQKTNSLILKISDPHSLAKQWNQLIWSYLEKRLCIQTSFRSRLHENWKKLTIISQLMLIPKIIKPYWEKQKGLSAKLKLKRILLQQKHHFTFSIKCFRMSMIKSLLTGTKLIIWKKWWLIALTFL